jgi:RNA polymerase sigma factor (sigma-70 family)
MPIRDDEKFCKCFIADTEAEAEKILKEFDYNLKLLANKVHTLTGLDPEDLYQEGIIGLARASRDFDEERSDNFKIFAIYKIKDAMREFGTTQAISIKIPQYTKDAIRLAHVLREHLVKAGEYQYTALADMWDASSKYIGDGPLEISIQSSRQSLINLANRSHTSVKQLLERSETMPSFSLDITEISNKDIIDDRSVENDMVNRLNVVEMIERVKDCLSDEDYKLLWNRYAEGMTVRELAPLMGISAPHVSDRTQALLKKLSKLAEYREA